MNINEVFEALEKYENRYGLSVPIGAYLQIKAKFLNKRPILFKSENIYKGEFPKRIE